MAFTILLLAQAGVPLTSGFVGKFQVIAAAVGHRSYLLAAVAMLSAVIGAYMYLRIVMTMYVVDDDTEGPSPTLHWTVAIVLIGTVGFTLLVGIVPQFLIEFAEDAVPVLIRG